jgi:hypothetical protein
VAIGPLLNFIALFIAQKLHARTADEGVAAKTAEEDLGRGRERGVNKVVVTASVFTFGIRLEIPNPKYQLPAGLKCRVIFPPVR